jgi:hypothetical protein
MKTEELVALLSMNPGPVARGSFARTFGVALAASSVLAVGISLVGLGFRPDLTTTRALIFLLLKLLFAAAVVGIASVYLARLARPGGERRISSISMVAPFAAIILLAVISLGLAPRSHWDKMVTGGEWLECLVSIPIIAIVPFVIAIWAIRRAAPTNSPAQALSPASLRAASARWLMRCTARTIRCRSSRSGTAARSCCARWQERCWDRGCCAGDAK